MTVPPPFHCLSLTVPLPYHCLSLTVPLQVLMLAESPKFEWAQLSAAELCAHLASDDPAKVRDSVAVSGPLLDRYWAVFDRNSR